MCKERAEYQIEHSESDPKERIRYCIEKTVGIIEKYTNASRYVKTDYSRKILHFHFQGLIVDTWNRDEIYGNTRAMLDNILNSEGQLKLNTLVINGKVWSIDDEENIGYNSMSLHSKTMVNLYRMCEGSDMNVVNILKGS